VSSTEPSARIYARDTTARSYARHRAGEAFVVDALRRIARMSPGGAVLEIGCGTGVYATALAAGHGGHGLRVYAMDLSLEMLRRAPAREKLIRVQGRATHLPFADGAIGMIFSVNVIHHLPAVDDYFREAARVLKPGGILCTATDSKEIIERRAPLSRYWPSTVPRELGRYHDLRLLRAQMTAAGFCNIDEREGRSEFSIADAGAYREKAFSCLRLIPEDAFRRGLSAMEADLRLGPVKGVSELVFLWGERA
jgi:ubiquinone/menaquinone biosynthesis C-methylase UbiE